jgi:hypothetical protein
MTKIVIAHGHTSIEVLHTMSPFILSLKEKNNWKWEYTDYRFSNIFKKQGDLLILVRKYHDGLTTEEDIIFELLRLRKNFTKIVYFDDSATAVNMFFSVFPYVDQYWKRSCLNDKSLYYKNFFDGHLFSDYYYSKYKIDKKNQKFFNSVIKDNTELHKLKVAWNIGIGAYPLNKKNIFDEYYPWMRKIITGMSIFPSIQPVFFFISNYFNRMKNELSNEISYQNKVKKISSRFISSNYTEAIGFQRELLKNKINNNKNFLVGLVNKRKYINETFEVFGMLSPFGWGEVCYRDFEAAIGGCYLIKPDMSHIDTWPNIYEKDMYYSLFWDLSNFSKLDLLFEQSKICEEAVNKTRRKYLKSLEELTSRCIGMIENVL